MYTCIAFCFDTEKKRSVDTQNKLQTASPTLPVPISYLHWLYWFVNLLFSPKELSRKEIIISLE